MEIDPILSSNQEIQIQPSSSVVSGIVSPIEKRKREDEDDGNPPPESESGSGSDMGRHTLWKTSLCSYFRRGGIDDCSHGETCRYAHGEAELRLRPDNSWDPTSERAKKIMRTSEAEAEDPIEEEQVDFTTLDKCLIGLSKNWVSDHLNKFLHTHGIHYKSAKKKKGMNLGFVVFEDAEQVKNAIEVLNEKSTGGKQIKVADAIRRSNEKKHTSIITESHRGNEDNSVEDNDAIGKDTSTAQGLGRKTRNVRDVVTPLAHMSYSDQLEHKKNSLAQNLKRLTRNARKACPNGVTLPEWILKSREIGGLPCKLEGILESPLVDGYRNKCEFSVGQSVEGKRTVGFMLGNFREGVTAVEEPVNCPNVSVISCKYALIFQDFLQSSEFPVWNRFDNTGFWRQFTVREGRRPGQAAIAENADALIAEVMLIIQVCSVNVDEEQMKNEFDRMALALAQGAASSSPPLPLTKIVVQDHKGISNAAPSDCPLLPLPIPNVGQFTLEESLTTEARIHDYISSLCFSISPTAFFQVNTLAAERLYSLAGDWAELSSDTLLFDVCCGTGTIGLTLAHRVGMVVGIEMNASAVSDANRNAEINGIKNCKFVCGKRLPGPWLTCMTNRKHSPFQACQRVWKGCSVIQNADLLKEKEELAEDVMGALLKEYLGVPQEQTEAFEELPQPVAASHDIVTSTEEILPCEGSTTLGASEQNLDGESPLDCNKEECEDASQENLKCVDISNENAQRRYTSKDNCISEDKKTTDAVAVRQFKDVVAIVDPPRVGLHPIVIKALRTHPRIRRLVYISCNPESLVANAIELCTPTSDTLEKGKGNRGWRKMSNAGLARQRAKNMPSSEPFKPMRAIAVDLFPHTPHCEMVMLLER